MGDRRMENGGGHRRMDRRSERRTTHAHSRGKRGKWCEGGLEGRKDAHAHYVQTDTSGWKICYEDSFRRVAL